MGWLPPFGNRGETLLAARVGAEDSPHAGGQPRVRVQRRAARKDSGGAHWLLSAPTERHRPRSTAAVRWTSLSALDVPFPGRSDAPSSSKRTTATDASSKSATGPQPATNSTASRSTVTSCHRNRPSTSSNPLAEHHRTGARGVPAARDCLVRSAGSVAKEASGSAAPTCPLGTRCSTRRRLSLTAASVDTRHSQDEARIAQSKRKSNRRVLSAGKEQQRGTATTHVVLAGATARRAGECGSRGNEISLAEAVVDVS
jgi:hypothetical protein